MNLATYTSTSGLDDCLSIDLYSGLVWFSAECVTTPEQAKAILEAALENLVRWRLEQ
jgi:hypothetical protein